MKTTFFSGLLILTGLFGCQPNPKTASSSSAESTSQTASASFITLSAQEFASKSTSGTVIDVRTAGEVAQGKIADALEIDYYRPNFLDQVSQLPKDQELYLYCAVKKLLACSFSKATRKFTTCKGAFKVGAKREWQW
jgi:hypothetical protein